MNWAMDSGGYTRRDFAFWRAPIREIHADMQQGGSDFACMIMVHHKGAPDMVQVELAKGQHKKIKEMAQQMMADQQREIVEFQACRDKNRN